MKYGENSYIFRDQKILSVEFVQRLRRGKESFKIKKLILLLAFAESMVKKPSILVSIITLLRADLGPFNLFLVYLLCSL